MTKSEHYRTELADFKQVGSSRRALLHLVGPSDDMRLSDVLADEVDTLREESAQLPECLDYERDYNALTGKCDELAQVRDAKAAAAANITQEGNADAFQKARFDEESLALVVDELKRRAESSRAKALKAVRELTERHQRTMLAKVRKDREELHQELGKLVTDVLGRLYLNKAEQRKATVIKPDLSCVLELPEVPQPVEA